MSEAAATEIQYTEGTGALLEEAVRTGSVLSMMRFTDISVADLSGTLICSDSIFIRCHFAQGQLARSMMKDCLFEALDATAMVLDESVIERCVFSDCTMPQMSCVGAMMNSVDVHDTNWQGADIAQAIIEDSDFTGSNLSQMHAHSTQFIGCNLTAVDFSASDAYRSAWQACNFTDAIVADVNYERAVLRGAQWTGIDARGMRATQADFLGACLKDAQCMGAQMCNAGLSTVDMSGADFSGADMSYADMRQVQAQGMIAVAAVFTGAECTQAHFSQANLSQLQATTWRITEADFTGATLTAAVLDQADCSHADFTGAQLDGVSWNGANLHRTQFDNAATAATALAQGHATDAQRASAEDCSDALSLKREHARKDMQHADT